MKIGYDEIRLWVWVIMIITLLLALCSCSASYHLKKAYDKDPSLVVKDTIKEFKIRSFETFKSSFNINTLERENIVLESIIRTDTVKIYIERQGEEAKLSIDCPDCVDSIVYVPQVRFIKEELSNRELFKEAKERLTDFQIARLAAGQLLSVFLLGVLVIILLRIFFTKFL